VYLTYLQEASSRLPTGRLVSKSSMRRMRKLCTLDPHVGDANELDVVDTMDAEDCGESVQEFLLERNSHGL
jgi:hypothetical protein